MKVIPTGKGPIFVDDQDFLFVLGLTPKWRLNPEGYAVAFIGGLDQHLHKLIAARRGLVGQIDHKNQNRADNQLHNLRVATTSQNSANRSLPTNSTSGFKGVHWRRKLNKWEASIHVRDKTIYLKLWLTPEEAAQAYDRAAIEHFGDFACTNFPRRQDELVKIPTGRL